MKSKLPPQFALVEHTEPCKFCWREKREFVQKVSILGDVDESELEKSISTWVRHNAVKLPLGVIYGVFTIASNILIFRREVGVAIGVGIGVAIFLTFIRSLLLWMFYRSHSDTLYSTMLSISQHTGTEIAQVAKWINDTLTELFLWRQFPRGISLVVASVYAVITLDFLVAGILGFTLWLIFGIARYPLWKLGHYDLDTIDFTRHGATRAELRPLWVDFFHISYFLFTSATIRWFIGFTCLFIILFRLNNLFGPTYFVEGYNWYFYFIVTNAVVSLRNDIV